MRDEGLEEGVSHDLLSIDRTAEREETCDHFPGFLHFPHDAKFSGIAMDASKLNAAVEVLCQKIGGDWLLLGGSLVRFDVDPSRGTRDKWGAGEFDWALFRAWATDALVAKARALFP